jgi:predicted lipoprotein with Yx(FWY)xxD motif
MTPPARFRMRRLVALSIALVAFTAVAVALAAGPTVKTGNASVSGKSKVVVVDTAGVTLYTLSGERVGNLKCINSTCFTFWLPYKVSASAKLTKTKAVRGTLSKLRRVKGGFYQVMLDGHPLYRFSYDMGKRGSAKGEGIKSFGGTWHVVTP